jgi:formate hydrogenlyase subunit 3/multisubunit Na+/H+ antiporter MnhD subunit
VCSSDLPLAGAAFIVGALALIGIPPLSGFASKLYIIQAALATPYAAIVIVAVVIAGSVMGAMIYFPFIFSILVRDRQVPHLPKIARGEQEYTRSRLSHLALVVLMVLTVGLGLFSPPLMGAIQRGLEVFG